MTATVLDVYDSDDPQAIIGEAVDRLNAGEIVAFPTETVYGIAANSSDTDAVANLYDVKSRSTGKPMSLAIGYDYSLDNYAQKPTAIMHLKTTGAHFKKSGGQQGKNQENMQKTSSKKARTNMKRHEVVELSVCLTFFDILRVNI